VQQEAIKILIIDDDVMVGEFLDVVLTNLGFQTTVTKSAEEGYAKFGETNYDLVLSDIFMAGMGGIDGIMMMRGAKADIPIIAMSAGYHDMTPEKALKAAELIGADGILAKPFDSKRLLAAIEQLLSKSADDEA